jgi:cobalamin biosynthesis protein CobT
MLRIILSNEACDKSHNDRLRDYLISVPHRLPVVVAECFPALKTRLFLRGRLTRHLTTITHRCGIFTFDSWFW